MLNDAFKARYTTIPFATFARCHTAGSRSRDLESLSHTHREMELLLVLKGSARFYIDTRAFDISQGDLILVAPWLLHRSTIFKDKDFQHICLCFDLSLLHDPGLQKSLESGSIAVTSVISDTQRYGNYVRAAFSVHAAQRPGWELQVCGNLAMLFGLLKEDGHLSAPDFPAEKSICYRITDYIAAHYPENITSADAARHFHMSPSHFCRLFRASFGHCFQNYLCIYRIEQAKLLLRRSDRAISQIAASVGFGSFSYFSKVFRAHTGLTPSEYRRQL